MRVYLRPTTPTFSDRYNSEMNLFGNFDYESGIFIMKYTRGRIIANRRKHLIIRFSGYLLTLMVGGPRVRRPFGLFLLTETGGRKTGGRRHFRTEVKLSVALSLWQTVVRNWIRFIKFQRNVQLSAINWRW